MAPHELPTGATTLPNPEFGDTETPMSEVQWVWAMDGTRYSTVTSSDYFIILYKLLLTKLKAWELREFFRNYHSNIIRIIDHNNIPWQALLLNNPVEYTAVGRAKTNCNTEYIEVNLEFKAKRL